VIWLAAPALASSVYCLLVIVAALRWRKSVSKSAGPVTPAPERCEPISILKPVHGRDPRFYEAIHSHAVQDYPGFEILFGVGDPHDLALEDIARLRREFPAVPIECFVVSTAAPNAKAGILAELARRARHPLLLVNDSDILVEPGYLRDVATPLADRQVGLVTCIYRARAESWPSRFEALGIATEFAPSVMAARLLGQAEFALGSTMAFRAADLRAIGGFEAISEYIADDYQLGRRVHSLGRRIEFAPPVVETDLGACSWKQVWRRQVRWSRTIRVSRPGGYLGYAITHATIWAALASAAGAWEVGVLTLGLRFAAGAISASVLGDRRALRSSWLIPFRDLFGFAVWLVGAFGSTAHWRDRELRLQRDGRIARGDRKP
jgi:ceramide glucosyltransferase